MKICKRILSLVLTLIMLISCLSFSSIVSYAETEGKCGDNLTWRFSPVNSVLTILGEGDMYNFNYNSEAPWYSFASKIERIVLGSGITSIGDEAFSECTQISTISFPSSLKRIGMYAFESCSSLESVVIPDNVTDLGSGAFSNCTSIEKAVIGNGITEIKYHTFNKCISLYEVKYPDNLVSIGEGAFSNCKAYENIELPESCIDLNYDSFWRTAFYNNEENWDSDGELYLNEYLLYVKDLSQSTVIVKLGTKYIAKWAMIDLGNLYKVYYPKSVEHINGELFELYDSMGTHVDYQYPHAFGYGGSDFFGGTWSITPSTGSCGKNVNYKFDETGTVLTIYGTGEMTNYDYNYHSYFGTALTTPWIWVEPYINEVVVEDGVTSIGSYALPAVSKLTLPDSITHIYSCAIATPKIFTMPKNLQFIDVNNFSSLVQEIIISEENPTYLTNNGILYSKDMKKLIKYPSGKAGEHFDVPYGVVTIGKSAFSNLKNLKSIYIPETVTTFEDYSLSLGNNVIVQCKLNSAAHNYAQKKKLNYEIVCNHSFTKYLIVDATCTDDGYKYAWCDHGCGTLDAFAYGSSAKGHNFSAYTYRKDATCTNDGTSISTCVNGCGTKDIRVEEGTALGHIYTDYDTIISADCTNNETKEAFCERGCGAKDIVSVEGSALGHSFVNYIEDNNATCTENGTKTAKCDRCNGTDTVEIENSALGHSFTNYEVISELSCTENGEKEAYCDNGCGEKDIITEEAFGHTLGEWIIIEEPTYDFEGYKIQNCTVCSEVINTETIPVLLYKGFPDVAEGAWYYDGVVHCVENGYIMGNDRGEFNPAGKLTREQFVVILARIAGAKLSEYTESPFTDVKADSWYGASVIWANEKGYINGIGGGKFGVGNAMTRETVAVILYRYSKDTEIYSDLLMSYSDEAEVSSWARTAVNWVLSNKLLGSTSSTALVFSPKMNLSRAQAAKIFMGYDYYITNQYNR